MKTNPLYILMLFAWLLPLMGHSQLSEPSTGIFPGTSFILPVETNIKLHWISPPVDQEAVSKTTNNQNNLLFSVDKNNQPWIAHSNQIILNLKQGYQIKLSHTFTDLVHFDNGALLISTPTELGFASTANDFKSNENNLPVIPFQPISSLPLHDCRMYRGAENCLYFTGRNTSTGENDVYLIKFEKNNSSGINENLFGQFHKIFSTDESITAVSGDGIDTYLALGNLVIKITGPEKQATKVYLHPDQEIKQMVYNKNEGLIYSTGTKVGYIGQSGAIEFLTAPLHSIASQNGNLYILFHESFGVLAIENTSELKKMDVPFKSASSLSANELKISAVRFFEFGMTDYQGITYADRFDRSTTRYVACQINLENQLKDNLQSHSLTAKWYTTTGGLLYSNTELVSFRPEEKFKIICFTIGSEEAGKLFPGQYSVVILIDAAQVLEKSFNVFGEVNCFDAIRYNDTSLLGELLENGADPNLKNEESTPLLHYAVVNGSLEDVRLILKYGANINIISDLRGETALFLSGWPQIKDGYQKAELLIKSGINIEAKDKQGKTAFFTMALPDWNRDYLSLLLKYGANINSTNDAGSSVLSVLISQNISGSYPEIIEFLLSHGARLNLDPEIADFINLLQGKPNPEYVRLFLKYGANIYQTGVDDRSRSGSLSSLLNCAFLTYLAYIKSDDRPNVQKSLEVINLLLEKRARFLPEEESIILNRDVWEVLDTDFIKAVLDRNQSLLLRAAAINDPRVQTYVIDKLLDIIRRKITESSSLNDLTDALNISYEVKNITEKKDNNLWPEVYLYCGLLEHQLGSNELAENHLRKYISLMPTNETNLDEINSLVKSLARKNKK